MMHLSKQHRAACGNSPHSIATIAGKGLLRRPKANQFILHSIHDETSPGRPASPTPGDSNRGIYQPGLRPPPGLPQSLGRLPPDLDALSTDLRRMREYLENLEAPEPNLQTSPHRRHNPDAPGESQGSLDAGPRPSSSFGASWTWSPPASGLGPGAFSPMTSSSSSGSLSPPPPPSSSGGASWTWSPPASGFGPGAFSAMSSSSSLLPTPPRSSRSIGSSWPWSPPASGFGPGAFSPMTSSSSSSSLNPSSWPSSSASASWPWSPPASGFGPGAFSPMSSSSSLLPSSQLDSKLNSRLSEVGTGMTLDAGSSSSSNHASSIADSSSKGRYNLAGWPAAVHQPEELAMSTLGGQGPILRPQQQQALLPPNMRALVAVLLLPVLLPHLSSWVQTISAAFGLMIFYMSRNIDPLV